MRCKECEEQARLLGMSGEREAALLAKVDGLQKRNLAYLNANVSLSTMGGDPGTTHSEGCWSWGPKHYGCALEEIQRLQRVIAEPATC